MTFTAASEPIPYAPGFWYALTLRDGRVCRRSSGWNPGWPKYDTPEAAQAEGQRYADMMATPPRVVTIVRVDGEFGDDPGDGHAPSFTGWQQELEDDDYRDKVRE